MKKILINKSLDGVSTALVKNGKLIELLQDATEESLAGNIYLGIVKKVTNAFIFLDIGHEKQAFLDTKDSRERRLFPPGKPPAKPGDTMVVQVLKDAIGNKGPNVTSSIAYTGRYIMIYESLDNDKINCSKKIQSYDEIKRLKTLASTLLPPGFSAILRSAADGKSEDVIGAEVEMLLERQAQTLENVQTKTPTTLFAQSGIVKTMLEIVSENVDQIVVDDAAVLKQIKEEFIPLMGADFGQKLVSHQSSECIFEANFVKNQMDKLYDKRVWLKCGGFIVIEQTEACVVIDVNTGKFQSKGGEMSKLALNIEAATEIAYQLRLRNLSGIIIVDFLRMLSRQDTHKLLKFLELELYKDRISALLVGMTNLGLVELTRKRVRKPLVRGR